MIQKAHMINAANTARRRWPERGIRGGDATSSSQSPTPKTSRVTASRSTGHPCWATAATPPGTCQATATIRSAAMNASDHGSSRCRRRRSATRSANARRCIG